MEISIVTPAYNEEENLPALYDRLAETMRASGIVWEWIIVDDCSRDRTFLVIGDIVKKNPSVRGLRFSRNFGSHAAITCGLAQCSGRAAIVLAADLQDPPETIPALLDGWRSGAKVVWAARRARFGESRSTILFARIYYWIMRNTAGMRDMPASGADFFLLDRAVIDALKAIDDKNTSVMGLITWLGFDQHVVEYDKQARMHGETGWTFSKKLKFAIDSIAGFSYFPIRFISLMGLVIAFCGFIAAAVVVYNAVVTDLVTGWASIMVALLVLNGLQMLMLGVLGEYIWRGLDETRNRPRYVVQEKVNEAPDAPKKQK